jgi:hypothetical protein
LASSSGIAEADWRVLRKLQPIALDRFCQRIFREIDAIRADPNQSSHQKYLAIYQLIDRRNEEMAQTFDDMRRSMAVTRIGAMRHLGLLTDEEFGQFSDETRYAVQRMLALSAE